MITFCIWKFCDIIKAALTTNASVANDEMAAMVELILERKVSLWSLNTAAVAPIDCASTNAASTLHLIQPTGGSLQVNKISSDAPMSSFAYLNTLASILEADENLVSADV
ncbi:uncharacterized protein DS421_9g263590 [Arachis hypogaea]|nr:uncharacterized protein DS421_9g263590 [Arachis hypogaea]